ncbi:phage tail tape measure protein [Polymorphum gilvum]|uniref:Gene transfer agent (GTA)-like protein n=1 Tax=Polymorphum gilvum (strain LMG 25793 / CGMCC 1.9160 / SL003B-26A1) TaxID=991905 RepID=F2J6H3_POLGS|nr:phage tail tape measure protein [Polymorphum gilvum]ADZ71347.1 Gene transfer agent (GTA)-like protein [Polymorphum gilvum SL003B-26A1]
MARDDDGFSVPLDDLAAFSRQMEAMTRSAGDFSRLVSGGLRAALVDGKALDAVFRSMALSLSSRVLAGALRPLETLAGTAVAGLVGSLAGTAAGAVGPGARVTAFADGGVIAAPTYFGIGANGAGGLGVMGEAGAEAILPLARGADGRLGVASRGGAEPKVVVNVTTRDADSFRRSEAQVSAMVARAVGRGRRGL